MDEIMKIIQKGREERHSNHVRAGKSLREKYIQQGRAQQKIEDIEDEIKFLEGHKKVCGYKLELNSRLQELKSQLEKEKTLPFQDKSNGDGK